MSHEKKLLRNVRYGTLILLAIFAIQGFTRLPEVWPLSRWRMYSGPRVLEPEVEAAGVTVTSASGEEHTLYRSDLGLIANRIIHGAFGADAPAYRPELIRQIQLALPGVEISKVTGWQFIYEVDYFAVPPIQFSQPKESVELGSFTRDIES